MRALHPAIRLLPAFAAFALAACGGGPQPEAARAERKPDPDSTEARLDRVSHFKRGREDAATRTRLRFSSADTLDLAFADLVDGRQVLIKNPTQRASVRLLVEDRKETHPLSAVLGLADTTPPLRVGTPAAPGTTLVRFAAASSARPPAPGVYEGALVVDTGNVRVAEREVRVTVPAPVAASVDSGWNASIYKLAPLPGLRAMVFQNAEVRCARDTREGQQAASSRLSGVVRVMGTCVRDNVIPVRGARTRDPLSRDERDRVRFRWPWQRDRDSTLIERSPPPHTLLGVLQSETDGDKALVWWTGDSLEVARQGIELHFTSFDHPGTYSGTIDLSRAGAADRVRLRVRVTHDWLMALLFIAIGVYLSWWLRNYVRTRRAVLRMQEIAAGLVSRIHLANETFLSLDSRVSGYQVYMVDEGLLGRIQLLEKRLQEHAYEGTALEPGKPEHDEILKHLEECEVDVIAWEGLAAVLANLRAGLDEAELLQAKLRPEEVPVLMEQAETLFDGGRLTVAQVGPQDERATQIEDVVGCWNEVAQSAVSLQERLGALPEAEQDEGRATARAGLDSALAELWTATDAATVKAISLRITEAGKRFRGKQRVFAIFGKRADRAAEDAALPSAAAPAPASDPSLVLAAAGQELVPAAQADARTGQDASDERPGGDDSLRQRQKRDAKRRKTAAELKKQAEERRKWNDRKYFALTLTVAAATGLNQLYFKDGGFGTMQHYLLALLWGFGTKMGLDTVRGAVEAGRVPWPFGKDAAAPQPEQTGQQQGGQTAAPGATTQPGSTQNTDPPNPGMPQGEGGSEEDAGQKPAAGERVKTPEELAAAG